MENFHMMVFGKAALSNVALIDKLRERLILREVTSVERSDIIIAFVTVTSRAGTDIEAALHKIPISKPVVLMVLHHTFDPYFVAPDSRLNVNREDVFTVDCLFHEDQGLLRCQRNDEALKKVTDHLKSQGVQETVYSEPKEPIYASNAKSSVCPQQISQQIQVSFLFFICATFGILFGMLIGNLGPGYGVVTGMFIGAAVGYLLYVNPSCLQRGSGRPMEPAASTSPTTMKEFHMMVFGHAALSNVALINKLRERLILQEVTSLERSDIIIAFVTIASRAGTDIEAALKKIPQSSKPVVLVVLHHTFDRYFVAPDSRLNVNRSDVFTVDCLFHEDQGLLRCERNNEALEAVTAHLKSLGVSAEGYQQTEPMNKPATYLLFPQQNSQRNQVLIMFIVCIVLGMFIGLLIGYLGDVPGLCIGLCIGVGIGYILYVRRSQEHSGRLYGRLSEPLV